MPGPAAAIATTFISPPALFAPTLPLHRRRRYLDARTRPSFLKLHTKSSPSATTSTLTISPKRSSLGKILSRVAVPYLFSHQRRSISHSQRLPTAAAAICGTVLSSKCSIGQTQTVDRQSSKTTISPLGLGMQKTPKLEKGGDGGPPRDGGGGGGGGGGGSSSGGFFLFAILLFLRFLKDKEREKEKGKEFTPLVGDDEDY